MIAAFRDNTSPWNHCLQAALTVTLVLGFSFGAQAQERLTVLNDTFSVGVSSAGFGPVSRTITSGTGQVAAITGVPTSGTLTVPNFSFTLVETGVTNEVKLFNAAIIISENSSQRRLEVYIPGISMDFSGAGLAGSLTNPTVKIYGRNSDGSVTASTSVSGVGSITFSGNSLSFDAAGQIAKIQAQGGVLGDIVSSINNTGLAYTYKVILKQYGAGAAVTFATTNTTALPSATNNEFVLDSTGNGPDIDDFTGGYYVTGTVSFSAPSSGGSSTPTQTPQAAADEAVGSAGLATTGLASTVAATGFNSSSLATFKTLIASTTTTATTVAEGLKAGTVSASTGLALLASLSTQMHLVYLATSTGQPIDDSVRSTLIRNMSTVIGGLKGKALTPEQIATVEQAVDATLDDADNIFSALKAIFSLLSVDPLVSYDAITVNTLTTEIPVLIADLEVLINNALEIPGYQIKTATFTSLQNASQSALELLFQAVGTELGLNVSYSSEIAAQELLTEQPNLLDRIFEGVAINIGASTAITTTDIESSLVAAGLSSTFAANLGADLTLFSRPDTLALFGGTVLDLLQTALGDASAAVDPTSGVISYTESGLSYSAFLRSVSPAPAALPTGSRLLTDGSRLIVNDGLAFVLVPAISDINGFAGAINTVGAGNFSTGLQENGAIVLVETASEIKFVAGVSTAADISAAATGDTTFTAPSGDPAATAYKFTVTHADGTQQELVPLLADSAFFRSVANYGFRITTDRATGVVQIGDFMFRPDYFQTPLTSADTLLLNSAGDSSGVAYRAVDANGDGITDYEVLTPTGVQTMYSQP